MDRFTHPQTQTTAAPQPSAKPVAPQTNSILKSFNKPTLGSKLLVLAIIVAAIAVTLSMAFNVYKSFNTKSLVKDDKYQAVFLDNGQVYFGRLASVNNDYVRLTDIYYLQVEQAVQPDQQKPGETAEAQQKISLAKLGNELHGPEDEMFILRAKVVFWENLKDDGQVTKAITEHKNNPNPEPAPTQQPQQ